MRKGQKHTEEAKEKNRIAHLGHIPWNKGTKGICKGFNKHHVLKSKIKMSKTKKKLFAEGKIIPWNYLDGRSRKKQSKVPSKYINGKMVSISHIVWCSQKENLPYIPTGFLVHHIDLNKYNNTPKNLLLINRSIHNYIHNNISKVLLGVN